MLKRLLATLFAVALLIGLAACGNSANADETTGRPCSEVRKDLKQEKANVTKQGGTPAESEARKKVSTLEDELKSCKKGSNSPTTTEASITTTTVAAEPKDCPEGVPVKLNTNEKNRVLENGITTPETEEMRDRVAKLVGSDPNALFLYYNASPLGQTDPLGDVNGLVEGGVVKNGACFSERGLKAIAKWSVLWETAKITPVDAMPEGWANTGVNEAGPTVGSTPSGDTSGWKVTFVGADGKPVSEHGVMKRCGNPVVPKAPPGVPKGPTDEPPPTTTPPPATPVCPPGKPYGKPPDCYGPKNPSEDPEPQGNNRPGGGGVEEGGSSEGGPKPPAGTPPPTYTPPTTPTAPPTTRPGPPVSHTPTTSPPATTPPVVAAPTTMVPPPR